MRAINDTINEAREIKYRVAFFLPDVDMADVPPFTVMVPAKYARAFESFLENEKVIQSFMHQMKTEILKFNNLLYK